MFQIIKLKHMKSKFLKYFVLAVLLLTVFSYADAQNRRNRRGGNNPQPNNANSGAGGTNAPNPGNGSGATNGPTPKDTIPRVKVTRRSLESNTTILDTFNNERTVLPYEFINRDHYAWSHKIWRELDVREKMNQIFTYDEEEDNGNQRFISIIMEALNDSVVAAFDPIDNGRLIKSLTKSEIARQILGDEIDVQIVDNSPQGYHTERRRNKINWDSSIIKWQIQEDVIFDRESSRLFWRINAIAPCMVMRTTDGKILDSTASPIFWINYRQLRPYLSKYYVYNPKNFSARLTWDDLFETRQFSARIIKSTMDNPRNKAFKEIPGLREDPMLQLMEGERVKEKIFNYEQDLWSY
jgi:gliding motility associated protien GldN